MESILSTFINSGKSLNIEEDFINDQLTIEDQNEKFQQSLSSKSGLLISKKSLENCLCRNYFDNLLFDDEGYSYKCRLNFFDNFKLLSFWGKS